MSVRLSVILALIFFSYQCAGQSKGYLGKRMEISVGASPGLGVNIIDLDSSNGPDVSDELLLGGSSGIGLVSVYKAVHVSASYIISRKRTLGLKLTNGSFLGTWSGGFNSYGSGYFALKRNVVQLKYDIYSGIAPLKRYTRLGIGVDLVQVDNDKLPSNLSDVSELEDYSASIPFITLGLGGHEFVSKSIFINYGVDVNLSFFKELSDPYIQANGYEVEPLKFSASSRFIELLLGIGISI